jgi:hypothetical protein
VRLDQALLSTEASVSTSCGRFQRFNYRHCGRCVPCQIRRAAFTAWGHDDPTEYVYADLGRPDEDHAAFDDVRSVALARLVVAEEGFDRWLGPTLSSRGSRTEQRYARCFSEDSTNWGRCTGSTAWRDRLPLSSRSLPQPRRDS